MLVAFLFVGYFVLEGFDFGVGMSLPFLGKDDIDRRVLINTIGPVWDLNETWLIVAGACLFAAFPEWYATLFSGFYLALLLILVALIVRGVSFEYRGKATSPRGGGAGTLHHRRLRRARAAVGRGVRQHRAGGADRRGPQLHRHPVHPAQPVRAARRRRPRCAVLHPRRDLRGAEDRRGRSEAGPALWPAGSGIVTVVLAAVAFLSLDAPGPTATLTSGLLSGARRAVALVGALLANRSGARGLGLRVLGAGDRSLLVAASLFAALYPDVMPSTTDPAFSLTIENASSTPYTLEVMSWVARSSCRSSWPTRRWTYWVFRKRIGRRHIPAGCPARPVPRRSWQARHRRPDRAPARSAAAPPRPGHPTFLLLRGARAGARRWPSSRQAVLLASAITAVFLGGADLARRRAGPGSPLAVAVRALLAWAATRWPSARLGRGQVAAAHGAPAPGHPARAVLARRRQRPSSPSSPPAAWTPSIPTSPATFPSWC